MPQPLRHTLRTLALGLALPLLLTAESAAQLPRLHLGRRLQLTERAWDEKGHEAGKAILMPAFQAAVTSFFTGRFADGAKALDRARFRLLEGREPSDLELARLGLEILTLVRFFASYEKGLVAVIDPFYEVEGTRADLDALELVFVSAKGDLVLPKRAAETVRWDAPEGGWPEGDHALVLRDERGREISRITISMASELPRRFERLLRVIEGKSGVAARSLALGTNNLQRLNGAQVFERHVPALAELEALERLAAELEAGTPPCAGEGDWLLDLSAEPEKELPARFYAPARAKEGAEPARPLVIALHGMGGSEHIFFDASGAGRIVRLARERGWLLVAPKVVGDSGFVERVIEAVEELRAVDRSRVFLVGHSMGASRACGAVQRSPRLYRAVALFGGAGRLKDPLAAKSVAFWVGIGTQDFAYRGAVSFARTLQKAEHPRVVLQELPGVEHYTVMQLGLDAAFAFFDAEAQRGG
ncbi:MAG: hypothetical protein IPN34_13100 [Planctomycetes bacterium]|nr:hypothetical protein [Planctomycetota bacterium]